MKLQNAHLISCLIGMAFLSSSFPVFAQSQIDSANRQALIADASNELPGKVVFSAGDRYTTNSDTDNIPQTNKKGMYIVGRKDVERIGKNRLFSLFLYQDGLIGLVIIQGRRINYIGDREYLLMKLNKVGHHRYILYAMRDYYEGGDDYYEVDLRNINNPIIRQIDLATAQKLG